jgi:hydroxymethylpyrimidine pyrophosphatase-like HAD family hydrolase
VQFPPKVVPAFTDVHLKTAVKIVGVSNDLDRVADCERKVRAALGNTVSAARSQPYYLDVTHPDANKGGVVGYLSRTLGIDPGRIATIGDQPNDVLMFKPSGFSIAMGNASEAVQKEADAVTDSYDDDGFAKAVEKFILQ